MDPCSTLIGDISFPRLPTNFDPSMPDGPRGKTPEEVDMLFGNCIRQVNIGSSTTEGMKKQETRNKATSSARFLVILLS